jgi:transcriptional regulator
MAVEQIEGSFKLNQHKSDADHVAVATALAAQDGAGAQKIAADMRAMRPQAFAAEHRSEAERQATPGRGGVHRAGGSRA